MMPVIEISDDVMDMLKEFAEPFEDTPDSVLRKILNDYIGRIKIGNHGNPVSSQGASGHLRESLPKAIPSNFPRHSRMIDRYGRWIIIALEALGGSARREKVHNYIQKVFGQEFPEWDRECILSGDTPRWVKNADWAKFELKRVGILNGKAPWGVWELTEKGKTFYK